ncbi:hypothetical protein [Acidiplasma sp.]|uniref:hypothetical protein n=1 Tax=Acidiplasma sp. TaxID=1872114 RepID=UPI003161FC2D
MGELPNAREILASKVAEAPLESQMGWVHGSRQTRTYIHLSMRDQDNAILKAYGIKIDENKIIEPMPKKCPRCNALNPEDAKYCHPRQYKELQRR